MTTHKHNRTLLPPSARFARIWLRTLPACLVLLLSPLALAAQTSSSLLEQKDAEIAALKAEIARLKSGVATPASPGTTSAAAAPQTAAPATATSANAPTDNSVLQLSKFEVRSTQGVGYSQGNSASALKTSESLMKLPAQIIVVTNDMIKDIGSGFASDVLTYAGLVPYYRGPAIMSRGSRVGNPYVDDVPWVGGIGVSDNTNIDTYQVIKGPQQVLYPLASLGGLVLQTTKKPLPGVKQGSVDLRYTQWGQHNITFDLNQPLATVNDAKVTGRLVAVDQAGDRAFYNSKDDKRGFFPSFSLDWKNTIVTAQYGHMVYKYLPGGTGILTPDGDVYVGLGVRQQNSPRGNVDTNTQDEGRIAWTQILSSNWQVKSQVSYQSIERYGSSAFPTTVNWNNNTITYTLRKNNGFQQSFDYQTDVSGSYQIGMFPMRTAFGYNLHDQTGRSQFLVTTAASFPSAYTITIPIGDAAAINAIQLPPATDYIPGSNGNPGSRTKQNVGNGYFMQTVEIIPNRLTLVGGLTYSNIETFTDTNLAVRNPFTGTDSVATEFLHRYGAVWTVTKSLSAYYSESTTFNPAVGVQFDNSPLPSVLGKSREIGIKTSLWDGKVSFSFAAYKMELTNQAILAAFPALNVAGLNYFIPIGTTNSKGWDASFSLNPITGLQVVGTAYQGTVHDQNGNPITATVENSWSLYSRYDFDRGGPLKGFAIGGGAAKAGGKWFNMSGLVLPGGAALPKNSSGNSLFKLKQEVMANLFASYRLNRSWEFRIDCKNALDKSYPIGAQGVGLVDAAEPRTFSFQTTYRY